MKSSDPVDQIGRFHGVWLRTLRRAESSAERVDHTLADEFQTPLIERGVSLIVEYHEAAETDQAFAVLRRSADDLTAASVRPGREPSAIANAILVKIRMKVELMYDAGTSDRLMAAFESGFGRNGAAVTPVTKVELSDPVTRHLHQNYARILVSKTVAEALDGLRRHPPQGRILYLYVVNDDGHLEGVVPTRRLLLSTPDQQVSEIMVRKVVALPARTTVAEACEFFILHHFLAFPVVDDAHRLLGVVDVDLYTDEISELADGRVRDDLFQLLGVQADGVREGSPLRAFRLRFPWLGCNLAAGILAAFLSSAYKDELNRVVALAFFIPVVLNLAESVSSQSVSLALLALHGQRLSWRMIARKIGAELATGLMLGLAAGAAVGLVGLFWLGQARVALCLLGGIAGGVAGAAVLGAGMPSVLRMLRLEPRVAAGPIALAGADVITILLYFNLARWLLR
jgi:magnesium transporter